MYKNILTLNEKKSCMLKASRAVKAYFYKFRKLPLSLEDIPQDVFLLQQNEIFFGDTHLGLNELFLESINGNNFFWEDASDGTMLIAEIETGDSFNPKTRDNLAYIYSNESTHEKNAVILLKEDGFIDAYRSSSPPNVCIPPKFNHDPKIYSASVECKPG